MNRLSPDEITLHMEQIHGWTRQGEALCKTYKLSGFPAAIAFVTQIGFLAEAAGHHPDIDIRYNKVTLTLTTHDAGGLTMKDFALAAAADEAMG
ncbi:4a-hydroxytetrahydrobiopterin dehydratase [Candidatus Viridilinea mediisalina]|uniref:Putative pterin-4-alpha-carbinolamine dehydratase n=1 Tax=Candidatus Viridilinea mediisalina TaxID=2024553 RepID=A0A2A6RPJ4_9CHLR|nr:4a-hydroxytetrahydrobiopterin dehydratase [Candidatus Viridilinea mediisalina]PDW04845.1 4a-hydroxytetrahydrobiopterin dehydratase [Candidatus Viridilinea mediisalina]